MTWRRVILYYVLFAVALFYYWNSERRPSPVQEMAPQEPRLVDVSLDRLAELHLLRGEERVRCARQGAIWRVVYPTGARAPADLISSLVTTLAESRPAEVIAGRATDGSAFGLGSDALRVRLYEQGNNVPVTLILGKRNPTGTAVYAQVEGSPRVLLVGRILEYYVDRLFEEVGKRLQSGREPGVDAERVDQIG
jgi:hypothetical protein